MKFTKQLAYIAGSLIAFISLATLTGAMTSAHPAVESPPPIQTMVVTREKPFKDLNVMKDDWSLLWLSYDVSDYAVDKVGSLSIDGLKTELRDNGWTIDRIEGDEFEYFYWIDANGNVQEYCYYERDLYIEDGHEDMLRVRLRVEQGL